MACLSNFFLKGRVYLIASAFERQMISVVRALPVSVSQAWPDRPNDRSVPLEQKERDTMPPCRPASTPRLHDPEQRSCLFCSTPPVALSPRDSDDASLQRALRGMLIPAPGYIFSILKIGGQCFCPYTDFKHAAPFAKRFLSGREANSIV